MRGSRELTKQKDEENGEDKEKSSKLGVSPTQVAGGAMASATAAHLLADCIAQFAAKFLVERHGNLVTSRAEP